ncbi:alanine--tRNA ligase [Compostibacter hankyongensis]|uniref:Alanine--tRNA ligase n=1 Tax=Compostibacter hankyongensis TaxID=1007089 RepID=A0ABP8FDB6_9BACT
MTTASEIRRQFLDFFRSREHIIVPAAPIVIKNDPSLLFTNAGMNQFKDYFLGNKAPAKQRVADTQKCLRVSGKHNDLEEVGVDTYHHTMFEMLGNWSFGDPRHPENGYFKKEAIAWAWELLTAVYKIDKERLYVTVFEGDDPDKLPFDEESYREWEKWVPGERILKGSKKDNFWEMGDTGPCGPCSEIHVDCREAAEREAVDGGTLVNAGHPQVIEIWNLVFMQFNRLKDGSLQPLPARHVDTGMGFERLVRVLQGKQSNYDTDVFSGTIAFTEQLCGKQYGGSDSRADIAFRVIADHIRAIAFTIADGQLPSNTGAGYVIRRILRRAVRYYFSFLNRKQPLLHLLVPALAAQFDDVFPELRQQADFVQKVILEEEGNFLRTLESGMRRIDEYLTTAGTSGVIDGKTAFELYDTYGFPLDLTRLIAQEKDFGIDEAGFQAEMQQQKNRSRAATALDTGDWTVLREIPTAFVGYDDLLVPAQVTRYRSIKVKGREQYQLVLDNTPFYAESGGQTGDTGTLDFEGEVIPVTDTKKENDLIVHFTGKLPAGIEGPLTARVDTEKRLYTAYNHSATHLLHAALRKVLGTHVQQKGSLVTDSYLRFDFSHFARLSEEELREVTFLVNDKIRENIPVDIRYLPREEALKSGAMALFGEKYGDTVRVVTIDPAFSVELCGGTHVPATGMIGLFSIIHETAVAAGVRRIEAVTGRFAIKHIYDQLQSLHHIGASLKAKDPLKAIETLLQEKAALDKKVARLEQQQLQQLAEDLARGATETNGLFFIGKVVEVDSADALKQLCFLLKPRFDRYLFVLAAAVNGKAGIALMLDDATARQTGLEAPRIIREQVAPLIKGGGGGQPTFASAGGQDATRLEEAVEKVRTLVF